VGTQPPTADAFAAFPDFEGPPKQAPALFGAAAFPAVTDPKPTADALAAFPSFEELLKQSPVSFSTAGFPAVPEPTPLALPSPPLVNC
jgi:hypothetical protein